MEIKIGNRVYDEKTLQDMLKQLKKNCKFYDAYNYNKFLNETTIDGVKLIELLKELRIQTSRRIYKQKTRSLGLTQDQQFKLAVKFFNGLDKNIGALVKSILNEKNEDYKLNISSTGGSHVSHNGNNDFVEIFVELKDTVDNLHQLPHELVHAISGRNTQMLLLIKKLKQAKQTKDPQQIGQAKDNLDNFANRLDAYDRDCIGEIESIIVERLFYKFLLEKKIILKEDYKNYRYGAMNVFEDNLKQILEENQILNHLPEPIKFETAMDYVQILQQTKSFELLGRMRTMSEPGQKRGSGQIKSKYAMRYVVAEMVASQWFNLYKTSNKEEQQKMLQQFLKFLTKTGDFNIENSTQFLLNKSLAETINGFFDKLTDVQAIIHD